MLRDLNKLRLSLMAALALVLVLMFMPFVSRSLSTEETISYSGYRMMGSADSVMVGVRDARRHLLTDTDQAKTDYAHLYAVMMVAAAVGVGMCALDRRGAIQWIVGIAAGLTVAAMAVVILCVVPQVYHLPADYSNDASLILPIVTDRAGWSVWAALALGGVSAALSALGFKGRDRIKAEAPPAKLIARIGVMGAIAAVLYYIPGIPVIPPIYKLDFSTMPVLISGFAMGVGPGLIVLMIKDLTGIFHSSSMGVGELADLIASAAFMIPAVMIYQRRRTMKGALIGMSFGTVLMVIAGVLSNYFIMIPFYVQVMNMPLEQVVSMIGNTIPAVDNLWKLILLATAPFNLLKGVVLCLITMLIYKRLSPLLKSIG